MAAGASGEDRAAVLVVDDDRDDRLLLRGLLGASYRVLEAESGPRALEIVASEPVDLVLLDVKMPGMSGFEACREIKRAAGDGPFLPVLMVTVLGAQPDRIAGLAAGADDFLAKSIDRDELALRVAAFVRLRRQDQLIRQQLEELRHLSELKDNLISLIVHDVRNPLAGLLAMLSIIRGEAQDAAILEDVDAAMLAAQRIRDTLEDVHQTRRIEDGTLAPWLEARSIEAIVGDAVRAAEGAARERGITLRVSADGEPVHRVDATLLRRAIDNLLGNAIRYSRDAGDVDVTLRGGAGGVELEVADRGPGVPSAFRSALFQKYGAVEARRSETRRGYGLGLYLVKLVADRHGGTVSVLDREGGGAVFRVAIPAAPAPATADSGRIRTGDIASAARSSARSTS
jgi:two-component system, sensor histidine kinase and response regulator